MDTLDIPRIEWGEWKSSGTRTYGYNHSYRGGCSHWLEETGSNTNGCRYRVYGKGATLLNVMIKPPCCMGQGKCPVGKCQVPIDPCRNRLRLAAIEVAHQEWCKFLHTLAGSEGPALTDDN